MTMRTYALMKPDGVLEIAFQAEGISDAWIFVQDFMQRPVEDLDHSGFTVINVQVWPEGTQPAPVQGNTFWQTMESAPRDRDILLYIGERPADTPWVQGRYIHNVGSTEGWWSSTMGMHIHPTRWAEPPLPEFHVDDPALWARLPERMEVEPNTRVVNHANRTVLRGNGGRWNVIIEGSEWAILPASTREAILDVLRMPEGAERQELEHGLANAVIGIREDRESAQPEEIAVDIETVPLDGTFGPVSVDVQEPIVGPATPLVPLPRTDEETIGEAVRRILLDNRDQLMRGGAGNTVHGRTSFRIPDMRDNVAPITDEERQAMDELREREENRGSHFQSRIDIVRNADLSIANLFYGVERGPGEHDDNYRNRIIASLIEQREQEEVNPGVTARYMREFLELLPTDGSYYHLSGFHHTSLTVQLAIENGYIRWDGDRTTPMYRIREAGRARLAELQGTPEVPTMEDRVQRASGADLDNIARVHGLIRRNLMDSGMESDDGLSNRILSTLRLQRPTAPGVEDAIREMSPGVVRGVEAVLTTGELESGVFRINSHKVLRIEVVEH